MIELYKMTHDFYDPITTNALFKLSDIQSTRGHPYKLIYHSPPPTLSIARYFFSNRVAQQWKSLPEEMVCAGSVNSFKNKFDAYFKEYTYKCDLNLYCPYKL